MSSDRSRTSSKILRESSANCWSPLLPAITARWAGFGTPSTVARTALPPALVNISSGARSTIRVASARLNASAFRSEA